MNSFIRRFAAWPAPRFRDINVVRPDGVKKQSGLIAAGPKVDTNDQRAAAPPIRVRADESAVAAPAKIVERLGSARPVKPLFSSTSIPDDFKVTKLTPAPSDPPSVPNSNFSGTDLYSLFVQGLLASLEHREEYDRTTESFTEIQLAKPGAVNAWDEFMNLSYHGIRLCSEPAAPMDLATMTIGLVGLAGIRGRFRREGKLPPYLPASWSAKRSLTQIATDMDLSEAVGAETNIDDFFGSMGNPLSDEDEMPEATYYDEQTRDPFVSDGLEDDDESEEEEAGEYQGTPITLPPVPPLADELDGLLDREE